MHCKKNIQEVSKGAKKVARDISTHQNYASQISTALVLASGAGASRSIMNVGSSRARRVPERYRAVDLQVKFRSLISRPVSFVSRKKDTDKGDG
ncbi:unnamed protein product [Leptosia nina]|uniref:Uncharacterized protein n=1 Tax=Leptosia nina TaxID=320188 RepID=A0AAV1J6Q6_9NEOP